MDKKLFFFAVIGIGVLFVLTNFIGDVQKGDKRLQNEAYIQEHGNDQYKMTDSIGQDILNLMGVDEQKQVEVWNRSDLKVEFLSLFPDFSEMRRFANERIRGKFLKEKLLRHINKIEGEYFAGNIDAEQAKRLLELFQ